MEKIHDTKSIAKALQILLEKNHDAGEVYKDGLEDTESNELKDFLLTQATQRARFAQELEREIYQLDTTPISGGTIQGNFERAWMDVKTIFSENKDQTILEECLAGEKESLKEYKDSLKKYDFPSDVLRVLNGQLDEIKYTIKKISNLKDLETY